MQFYNQVLPLFRAVGNKGGEANTLKNLAKLKRKQDNLQASLNHIEKAIHLRCRLRLSHQGKRI
ncbi:MAG: hypothetical protein ACFB2X_15625 [Rivularia sp. (in: cyanobacteria)]